MIEKAVQQIRGKGLAMDNGLGTELFNANLGYSVYFLLLLLSFNAHGGIDISFRS